nr:MAG TPA: hypothetical protein [Caudoviricetes sp.]
MECFAKSRCVSAFYCSALLDCTQHGKIKAPGSWYDQPSGMDECFAE